MASLGALDPPILRRWGQAPWPAGWRQRWSLRLALALPFVAVALVEALRGVPSPANEALTAVPHHPGEFGWLVGAYPPLPRAVAVMTGNPAALGCLGALLAGVAVQLAVERLRLRSWGMPQAAVLVAGTAATPLFAYVAVTQFSAFLSLLFLSLGLTGLLDFAYNHSTRSGSVAGLSFGLASLCGLGAVAFALTGALAAVLIGRATEGSEPALRRATVALLAFPTLAALAGWTFLEWRFTGRAGASYFNSAPSFGHLAGGPGAAFVSALGSAGLDLLLTPLLVVAALVVGRRRPFSAVAALLPVATVVLLLWVGVPFGRPETLVLLELVALSTLPERPRRAEWGLFAAAATAQLAAVLAYAATSPAVTGWLHALG